MLDDESGNVEEVYGDYVEGGLKYDISRYGTYNVYVENSFIFSVRNSDE